MIKYYSCEDEGIVEQPEWQPRYWMNVENPGQYDCGVLRGLCVPESFLESVADRDERPRFEHEDGWLLTILRIPHRTADGYITVPLGVMTKGEIIITVCHISSQMIADFIEHSKKRHICVDNQPDFVLRLVYSSTFWFLQYLKEINASVAASTGLLRKSVRNELLLGLMSLQKSLVYFNTALQGNSMLIERLNKVYADDCDADLLEDVEIEIGQASNTVNVYMQILSTSMDTFASVISNNVNDIMKRMTSISIILMVPTLVASFYGMNVEVWGCAVSCAFGLIVSLSFLLAAAVWYWLHRLKWV